MCFPQGYLQAEISYKEKYYKLEKHFSKENCKMQEQVKQVSHYILVNSL